MSSKITICNICLNDIPADKKQLAKNGKEYVSIVVSNRKEPDKKGNTHSVYIEQTKEERSAGKEKIYCGSAKEISFQ